MISIVDMVDVHTNPATIQVWIVPGSLDDLDDNGQFSGWYIMDYLEKRGICVGKNLEETESKQMVEDIKRKFENIGFEVVVQPTAND